MHIVWKDALATGNEEIDDQHKELFRRFNDFQSACRQGMGLDVLSSLLGFLGDYVVSHFALEEQLQQAHNYPGFLKHKAEHDGFMHNFMKLEEQLAAEGTTHTLTIQTNIVMVNWLVRHFTWTDKDLANFLHTAPLPRIKPPSPSTYQTAQEKAGQIPFA